MIEPDLRATSYLRRALPESWDEATDLVGRLAEEIRYLPWPDRARAFDRVFWGEARARLPKEDVTAIINRQAASVADPAQLRCYTQFCRAVVTATLMLLEDRPLVDHEAAAIIHFFSLEPGHQELAAEWVGGDGRQERLAGGLCAWPGCAFLLLILSPSDSAESFLARDAFWAAMLGQR